MKIMQYTIKALVFIPLMLSLFFAVYSNNLVNTVTYLIDKEIASKELIIIGAAAIFLVFSSYLFFIAYVIRNKALVRMPEWKFILVVSGIAFFISLISVYVIDSNLFSDARMYHEKAIEIYHSKPSIKETIGDLGDLYFRRALVNIMPVYFVFGPNLLAMQLVNVLLHLLTGMMFYSFLRENLKSRVAARISLIFFFSIPIAYLTLNVTSHDVTGLFYLMVCFFLFGKIFKWIEYGKDILKVLPVSLFLGFMIFILELSRSIGTFLFYSLSLLLIINLVIALNEPLKKSRILFYIKRVAFLFIIPLLTYYFLKSELVSSNLNRGRFIMMFIASDTSDDNEGNYSEIADYKRYYGLIEREDREEMSLGKYASELHYNFADYINVLIRKNNRLLRLGETFTWSNTNNDRHFIWTVIAGHWIMTIIIRIIFYTFGLLGLIYLFTNRIRPTNPIILVVLTWFITLGILIFLGEVSPRYVYLFFLCLSMLAGVGFTLGISRFVRMINNLRRGVNSLKTRNIQIVLSVFTAFLIYVLLFSTLRNSFDKQELIFEDLREAQISGILPKEDTKVTLDDKLTIQEKPLKFGISLPDTNRTIFAVWQLPVEPGERYEVRGFLREKINRPENVVTVLKVNGEKIVDGNNTEIKRKGLKMDEDFEVMYFSSSMITPERNNLNITLSLEHSGGGMETANLRELSETYIEFLQVVPVKKIR